VKYIHFNKHIEISSSLLMADRGVNNLSCERGLREGFVRGVRCWKNSRKMKIKVLSRSEEETTRSKPTDIVKVHKNLDPIQHPFERAREYKRALNAVKVIFCKIFS
jgi:hypothetical protein